MKIYRVEFDEFFDDTYGGGNGCHLFKSAKSAVEFASSFLIGDDAVIENKIQKYVIDLKNTNWAITIYGWFNIEDSEDTQEPLQSLATIHVESVQ